MTRNRQGKRDRRSPFVGREEYLGKLAAVWKRKRAALAVCVGRRRIGKSRLIQEFSSRHAEHFLEFQGLPPRKGQTNEDQLRHFAERLAEYMHLDEPVALKNWTQAFALLAQLIPSRGRTVVLLDEISWMGRHDRDFAGRIKDAWDTRFSTHPNVLLVLCGSVSAWIEQNILHSTGFLDRPTLRINLPELSLLESNTLVWAGKQRVSVLEKLRMLAVTGGVPRYLEELDPRQSASDNIQRLCFDPTGALFRNRDGLSEFELIFAEVFQSRARAYRAIVETLASGRRTLVEICHTIGRSRSGVLNAYFQDLELAGYLREEPHFSVGRGERKGSHYRLRDNYLRFYLKYIEPRRKAIAQGRFRVASLDNLPGWNAILGLQFENLVLNSQGLIEEKLGIAGKVIQGGPYVQAATKRRRGCQIDLLLETEHSLYVCEVKLKKSIGAEVMAELTGKIERLVIPRSGRHLNVFPILIYAGGVDPAVRNTDFFHSVVDFGGTLSANGGSP